jgi:excisionase family DNA binding protein
MKKRRKPNIDAAPAIGDRLLTLREAADVLRLSTRTMREYVQRGEIEGRIIGGRWRFRRADLDAFFESAPRNWDFAGKDCNGD